MYFEPLKSSVGRKALVAVTGLVLVLFVIANMLGNLQIFLGQNWLNDYARHLQEMPFLLWPARIFLLLVLVVHMGLSLQLAAENRKARPVATIFKDTVEASLASRTMVLSGVLIFLFIVYHLLHFTFGVTHPGFFHLTDSEGRHDVYSMVVLSYQNRWISGVYILAMGVLYFHLSHGGASFLQSLGLADEKTLPALRRLGRLLAFLVFVGNCSIPAAVLLGFIRQKPGGL